MATQSSRLLSLIGVTLAMDNVLDHCDMDEIKILNRTCRRPPYLVLDNLQRSIQYLSDGRDDLHFHRAHLGGADRVGRHRPRNTTISLTQPTATDATKCDFRDVLQCCHKPLQATVADGRRRLSGTEIARMQRA
ncbi:hypothetical protein QBC41DRAFT_307438 [Cercophora samala]|uniref:Uncharacterized protein n=1 Tax=Cercophora samala TaxID=330535 RepID=A0AA39YZ33_9PEZI|nr:hypothetical protein QBC41DRAFT_307438 [Cercophora samala]